MLISEGAFFTVINVVENVRFSFLQYILSSHRVLIGSFSRMPPTPVHYQEFFPHITNAHV